MLTIEPLIADPLTGLFSNLDPDHRFVLIIIGISCFTAICIILGGIVSGIWGSIRVKQIEADLKRDMLDRGMSAEEIQQVIEATPATGIDKWVGAFCKGKPK